MGSDDGCSSSTWDNSHRDNDCDNTSSRTGSRTSASRQSRPVYSSTPSNAYTSQPQTSYSYSARPYTGNSVSNYYNSTVVSNSKPVQKPTSALTTIKVTENQPQTSARSDVTCVFSPPKPSFQLKTTEKDATPPLSMPLPSAQAQATLIRPASLAPGVHNIMSTQSLGKEAEPSAVKRSNDTVLNTPKDGYDYSLSTASSAYSEIGNDVPRFNNMCREGHRGAKHDATHTKAANLTSHGTSVENTRPSISKSDDIERADTGLSEKAVFHKTSPLHADASPVHAAPRFLSNRNGIDVQKYKTTRRRISCGGSGSSNRKVKILIIVLVVLLIAGAIGGGVASTKIKKAKKIKKNK